MREFRIGHPQVPLPSGIGDVAVGEAFDDGVGLGEASRCHLRVRSPEAVNLGKPSDLPAVDNRAVDVPHAQALRVLELAVTDEDKSHGRRGRLTLRALLCPGPSLSPHALSLALSGGAPTERVCAESRRSLATCLDVSGARARSNGVVRADGGFELNPPDAFHRGPSNRAG